MTPRWFAAALAFAALAFEPAYACRYHKPVDMEHLRYADLIVVGRISGFRIVRPELEPDLETAYPSAAFAQFEINAEEVLRGTVPERLIVNSYAHAFMEADQLRAEPYLFALRQPSSEFPPPIIAGEEALFFSNAVADQHAVLGAICSFPFMFESESSDADMVRRFLAGPQQ